jgi:hypothetical protein
MRREDYNAAMKLVENIAKIDYEIQLLEEQLASKNKLIRFGGQFNVSAPIESDEVVLNQLCSDLIHYKKRDREDLAQQLENL